MPSLSPSVVTTFTLGLIELHTTAIFEYVHHNYQARSASTKICAHHCSLKDGNGLSDRNFRPSPSPPRKNVCHLGCGVAAGWSLYPAVVAPVIQNCATRWCVRRCPSRAEICRRGSRIYLSSDKIPRTIESSLNGHHRNTPSNPQLPRPL